MLEKAIRLIENAPDSYEDFVIGMRAAFDRNPDIINPIIRYIEEDSSRNASDIIGRLWELEGIKKFENIDDVKWQDELMVVA